jgi:hypothetical protein
MEKFTHKKIPRNTTSSEEKQKRRKLKRKNKKWKKTGKERGVDV